MGKRSSRKKKCSYLMNLFIKKNSDMSRAYPVLLENDAKRLRVDLANVVVCVIIRNVEGHNRQRAITVPVVSFYPFESRINLPSLC